MRAALLLLVIARVAHAGVDDDVIGDADRAWCDERAVSYDEGARVGAERIFVRRAHVSCRAGASWIFATGAGWAGGRVVAAVWGRGGLDDLWQHAQDVLAAPSCGADRDPTDVEIRAGTDARRCAAFLERTVLVLAHALDHPPEPLTIEDVNARFFTDDVSD
jgi:hypothetical protein